MGRYFGSNFNYQSKELTMQNEDFVAEIAKLKPASTFLSLIGYRNENFEIANYSISFNMSYTNALQRSIATLEGLSLQTDLERQAREELLTSYRKSLSNPEKVEEREPAYTYYVDADDKPIKGIKLHIATGTLHLYGLVSQKRILLPGIYKTVNSKPLTIAKQKLSRLCSVGKFRQFKLTSNNVDSINVQGMELLPPE
jgi:hypothetical protein